MKIKKGDIIGIIGNVGSGKGIIIDFIEHHLNTRNKLSDCFEDDDNCNVINFADNLKQTISYLFGVPLTYLYDRKAKDELYYNFKNKALYDKNTIIKLNLTKVETIKMNNSLDRVELFDEDGHYMYSETWNTFLHDCNIVVKLRTFIQMFGTDFCRVIFGNNIWIDNAINKLVETKINIIGDIRFYDEYKSIIDFHCRGDKHFIKIVNNNPICKKYNHVSETNMNDKIEKGLVKAHVVTWDGNNDYQLHENIIKLLDKIEADEETK